VLIGKAILGSTDGTGEVDVPQLVGLTMEDAQQAAENSKVEVAQAGTARCDQPKGSICSQDPAPPKQMNEGETIQVVVSEGAPKVKVPDVVDKDVEDATEILEADKFKVETKEVESADEDPGTVLEQTPEGRSMAETGATVTLTVAKQAKQHLPNVTGKLYEHATNQLAALRFEVLPIYVASEQPVNTVISQDPQPGKVAKGSKVTLQVSKGPATTQIPVPAEIIGRRVAEARQILQQAGFTNIQIAPGMPQDNTAIVLRSNPTPGTPVDPATKPIILDTVAGGGGDGNNDGFGHGRN
jgi:serine/threonine-protein kinase